ncbi:response regulator [Kamptonema sp. UHCC 0994]|uniref:response regulator n=1 Tax=Kamptonema sp. UHCC 0994 TaxID=3031329 RepID=UPI0023B8BCF3|nr:response regulator [Kamptonema sp. UHCC 0994]MDF0552811.1 ATP-binding protein [Kamptonema sp. UHCC 0994]
MLLKSFTRRVSKVSGKIPLRIFLVVPFVLQVFGAVGLVGYLSFRNGQKAVNDVATQLRREVTDRVQQHLQNYLRQPNLINQINADAAKRGELTFDNFQASQYFIWQEIQSFIAINSIYISSKEGEFIYVKNEQDGTYTAKFVEQVPERRAYLIDSEGNPTKLTIIDKYDPRTRPWYIKTIKTKQPNWSAIYNFTGGELGITASRLLYDSQGNFRGVMGVDLILSLISDFLKTIHISPHGQVFIIERSGLLVGTSTAENPFIMDSIDKKAKRLNAIESKDPLTRATAQYLTKHFSNLSLLEKAQQLDFLIDGKKQFVQVVPYQDRMRLDWLIVVVVPESDFMEHIDANNRTTMLLCLGALLLATIVGILTSRWIVRPILKLKDAAIALSQGEFDREVNLERTDELGVLAHAFNSMAKQLQESFTSLENKNAELQQLDKLKDEFLANTSHELRTPLNGIIGIAESLVDGATGALPEKTVSNLALIVSSGRRLSNLVNDILDFSKLSHNNMELEIKPIGMREITEVVLTLSQPLVGKKTLELINAISPEVPLVDADENRMQQILHNIIGNAIKFTEKGTVKVSAEVVNSSSELLQEGYTKIVQSNELSTQNQQLAITVADTGIGIPADKLERIFGAFEQGDGSTAREYGGTGLGLAVTKQLVELHQGEIWVASTVGEGSKFIFTLPISQNQVQANQYVSPISSINKIQNSQPNTSTIEPLIHREVIDSVSGELKILIVDDEPVNIQVLINNLSVLKYEVTQATNGFEALEIIENGFRPDLILLDVMMPRMSGYEVCQILREKFPAIELPIVMLTAKNQVTDLVEGFNSGANDYLSKPFSKNELIARIKTHIRLAKINAAYGRFVPHEFLRFLGQESIVDVKLGDQIQKEMTVMFSDIRSFTTLSEGMSPEENFSFLNDYLSRVSPVIRDHNGFIDKYIGDAIMALFPESANDAVAGAIAMQKQVNIYNAERKQAGYLPISIGVGLHTGSLMLGTIGSQERMESTVIADAVNLASRLEGLTKLYGAGILISHKTLCSLDYTEEQKFRFLDRVMVKGKKAAVAIFEVFDGDYEEQNRLKTQTQARFEVAVFLYYQQQFDEAKIIFQEVLAVNPQDKAAMLYIKRCEKYQQYGVPEGWEGIEELQEK